MKPARVVAPVVVLLAVGAWMLTHRDGRALTVSGTIEADEARVATRVGGRVAALLVAEGDAVAPGQPLVRLDAPDVRARRDFAAAVLAELEAGPRTQEVQAVHAQWLALKAELDVARLDARRKEDLARQKTISDAERDDAVARLGSLEQRAAAAEQRYLELAAGTRAERLAQARAQLAEAEAQVAELEVVSPGACLVESISVKAGDVVPPQGVVATVLFRAAPWVRVYVPETWLGRVQPGGTARVTVDAFRGSVFTGRIEQVNRQAEFTPRNVQTVEERVKQVFGVKVRLPDDERLRPGMSADVRFPDQK